LRPVFCVVPLRSLIAEIDAELKEAVPKFLGEKREKPTDLI
jgi:hypothetical protein